MGFGFNLFFVFILLPLTFLLLLIWLIKRKRVFGKTIGLLWLGIFGLVLFSVTIRWLTGKTELEKKDYYGQYIVDRDFFPGKQSDWQYDNFRFEIKENDSIYFYVTDKDRIVKRYRGTIKTTTTYNSERLILNMNQPIHHIMSSNPTTYRSAWSFYLVFYSPKFNNVYFKKGKWKPIDN
ncbi:hypothetical protein HNP37_001678 [Flavobacterium nitrogenifigens]|uniref:Uncharacterized protein n=2 Tax=Flavobacterium TaxID=237 RepID=A0A7W7N7S0_9FLAO|nr:MULTISPECIES: hypothetical protein [Flavobacterium]MBB4801617.1 hypothetical protein [Flavobacterium nitrogenifigens]MBB6386575.1 hypothetical protein [Flavobacterium notoginsengisoli]